MKRLEITRAELFARFAAVPENHHAILEVYDGTTKVCAAAFEGDVWVSLMPLFSLRMSRAMAQRLSAMLANAVLSPESNSRRRPKAVAP